MNNQPTYQELETQIAELQKKNEILRLNFSNQSKEKGKGEDELSKAKGKRAKYEELANSITDVFFAFNNDLRYTYWNKASEKLTGILAEDAIGKTLYEIFPKTPDVELAEKSYREVIQTKKANSIINVNTINNHDYYFEINAYPTHEGISVFVKDITKQKNDEFDLIKAKNKSEENSIQLKVLNSTKDKLYSIIAHDLRSPFNGILGFPDLLLNSVNPLDLDKTIKYSTHINSTAKSTLVLLDNLLDWEKSQTGKINFSPEKLILSNIIYEIIDISNSNTKIKNISLNFNKSDDFDVFADINMLKTVLRNLISNAIKFTNSNGKIDIYTVQKQNMVEITISDNGIGMSNDKCNKLFNIGTDIITRGTAGEKGFGLGLLLCKEFVEKQGGKIWAESEIGKGSNFKFTLPLNLN